MNNGNTILAIVPSEFGPGMRLTGIPVVEANKKEEVQNRVEELLERGDTSVLILANRLYEKLTDKVRQHLDESSEPMLVNLPDEVDFSQSAQDHRQYVAEMIRRAIGFQIKVN